MVNNFRLPIRRRYFLIFLILLVFSIGAITFSSKITTVNAAAVYWDGGGTDGTCGGNPGDGNKWSCGANWSTNNVPQSADTATFDATSTKNCTIDTAINIAGIAINAGYSGTITQGSGIAITLGSAGFTQLTGHFIGSNANIDINNGSLTVRNTSIFDSTSAILSIERNLTIESTVTFTHCSGTIKFDGGDSTDDSMLDCGRQPFNIISINKTSTGADTTVDSNCTLPFGNSPTFSGGLLTNSGIITTGTGTVTFNMSYAQAEATSSFTSDATSLDVNYKASTATNPADLTITGGTFTASSLTDIYVTRNFDNSANILPVGTKIHLDGSNLFADSIITCGNLNNLGTFYFSKTDPSASVTISSGCNIGLGDNATSTAENIINNGILNIGGGTWTVNSSFTQNSADSQTLFSGTVIDINDKGNDSVSGGGGALTLSSGSFSAENLTDIYVQGNFNNAGNLIPLGTVIHLDGTGSNDGSTLTCGGSEESLSFIISKAYQNGGSVLISSGCEINLGNTPTTSAALITNEGVINVGTGTWTLNSSFIQNSATSSLGILSSSLDMHTIKISILDPVAIYLNLLDGTVTAPNLVSLETEGSVNNSANLLPTGLTITLNGDNMYDNSTLTCSGSENFLQVIISKGEYHEAVEFGAGCIIPLGDNPTTTASLITNRGTLTIGTGTWSLNSGFSQTDSTAALNYSGTTITMGDYVDNPWSTAGNFTLTSGTVSMPNLTTFNLRRNLNNSANLLPAGIDLVITGVGSFDDTVLTCGGSDQFNNVTINKYPLTLKFSGNCDINGNLTRTTGQVLNSDSQSIVSVEGDVSLSASHAFGGSNLRIALNGSNAQSISNTNSAAFSSPFQIDKIGANAVSLATNFSTTGATCTIAEGTFGLNGFTFSCGSTFTVEDGGIFRIQGIETTTVPTLVAGSTVEYSGVDDGVAYNYALQEWAYSNLTINALEASDMFRPTAALNLNGALEVKNGIFNQSNTGGVYESGLYGTYYDGMNFDTLMGNYVDSTINFNPADTVLGVNRAGGGDSFSVRWTGQVKADYSENYTFYTNSDNGVRLWVNETQLINNWTSHTTTENSGVIRLTAGHWYTIQLDFFDETGGSVITLSYSSPSTTKKIVPSVSLRTCATTCGNPDNPYALTANSYAQSGGTFTGASQMVTITGNFIHSLGSFTAPVTLNIGGNFTRSGGTFIHNGGTVVLNGSNQQISGNTIFNTFTKAPVATDTLTFAAGSRQTFIGTMRLEGVGGGVLSLLSSSPETAWEIDPQGSRTVSYLYVQDSHNIHATDINAIGVNVEDGDRNEGWDFNDTPAISSIGSISQATDGSGHIQFSAIISDADNHTTKLKVEYSDDGGATWYDPHLLSASPDSGSTDLDNSAAYQIGSASAIDTDGGAVTLTIIWDTKNAGNGNGSLNALSQDDILLRATGNDSYADGTVGVSTTFTVDNEVPTTSGIATTATPTSDTTPTWDWANGSDGSGVGIGGYAIEWSSNPTFSSGVYTLSVGSSVYTHTSPLSDGVWYLRYQAVDAVGNVSSISSNGTVTIDTEAPTATSILLVGGIAYTPARLNAVSLSATGAAEMRLSENDNFSGVSWEAYGTNDTFTLSTGDGVKRVYAQFRDVVGNESGVVSDTITLDTTDPITTDSGTDKDLYNNPVTVTFACSDGVGSGCAKTYYTIDGTDPTTGSSFGNSVTFSTDGVYIIKYFSVDEVGNEEIVKTAIRTVTIDTIAPAGTGITLALGAPYTTTVDTSATLMATEAIEMRVSEDDAFTGASWVTFDTEQLLTLSADDGEKTVYAQFRDQAGNESETVNDTIILDTTPPILTGFTVTTYTDTAVTLVWDSVSDSRFGAYTLWYGTSEADVAGRTGSANRWDMTHDTELATVATTTTTINDLTPNTGYYFLLIATDSLGNEGVSDRIFQQTAVRNSGEDGLVNEEDEDDPDTNRGGGATTLIPPSTGTINPPNGGDEELPNKGNDDEKSTPANIEVKEYSDTEVAIFWDTDIPTPSVVCYGTGDILGVCITDEEVTIRHEVYIRGLIPGVVYCFGVGSTEEEAQSEAVIPSFVLSVSVPESTQSTRWRETMCGILPSMCAVLADVVNAIVTAAQQIPPSVRYTAAAVGTTTGVMLLFAQSTVQMLVNLIEVSRTVPFWSVPGVVATMFKRKKNPWGVVYDSVTKEPLDPVIISVRSLVTGIESTVVSDMWGRYEFVVEPGEYILSAKKSNYVFPSEKLRGKATDAYFDNLYYGGTLSVGDSGKVMYAIPMDPLAGDWNQAEKRRRGYIHPIRITYLFFYLSLICYIAAFVGLGLTLILTPTLLNAMLSAFFVLSVLVSLRMQANRAVGYITDPNGAPLAGVAVHIHNIQFNKLKTPPLITTTKGAYSFLVPKGTYTISVTKEIEGQTRTLYVSDPILIRSKEGHIARNIVINGNQGN